MQPTHNLTNNIQHTQIPVSVIVELLEQVKQRCFTSSLIHLVDNKIHSYA